MAVNNTYLERVAAFTCTPASLIDSTPCLKCLSEKELLAALVALFAAQADKTVEEVTEESACYKCLSDKQLLQSLVTILGNTLLGEGETPSSVIEDYHCLVCLPEHDLKAALVRLICVYLATYTFTPQT